MAAIKKKISARLGTQYCEQKNLTVSETYSEESKNTNDADMSRAKPSAMQTFLAIAYRLIHVVVEGKTWRFSDDWGRCPPRDLPGTCWLALVLQIAANSF
ncbi:hypothetical protein PoB_004016200 [Plakobranchus ocellatus]|uniref:Uncharacterized protein n=1 Tax=Plakobranchus ocellatus TaxID=259542 RepID=A0AAV4B2B5_9GAST|nr:hypothetical protein PoB_004016200 [Plakobranchus ocellatus]